MVTTQKLKASHKWVLTLPDRCHLRNILEIANTLQMTSTNTLQEAMTKALQMFWQILTDDFCKSYTKCGSAIVHKIATNQPCPIWQIQIQVQVEIQAKVQVQIQIRKQMQNEYKYKYKHKYRYKYKHKYKCQYKYKAMRTSSDIVISHFCNVLPYLLFVTDTTDMSV